LSEAEEKNKALVRRLWEADARGDLETLDELLASDFVDHSLHPDQAQGPEGYMQSVAEDQAAFSDIHIDIEYQAAEDDKVITRLIISGLHDRGEYVATHILVQRSHGSDALDDLLKAGHSYVPPNTESYSRRWRSRALR
jgi:predicted ester cyclase